MSTRIKKVQRGHSGLRKSDLTSGRELLSKPNITQFDQNNNIPLGDPRPVFLCWACGSSKGLTTYHAAGGALGVCDRCKNGGQP